MDEAELAQTYYAFRDRYVDRDNRMSIMDAVVAGDWSVVDPDNDKVIARSPNLIQVALEDTAEAAGVVPTTRVVPYKSTATAKKKAAAMECIATGYLDFAQIELLIPQTVMDMAAFGFGVWVVWPDYDERLPFIERRDPRYCYPEPGFRPGNEVRRCMFSRQVHYSQMPPEYQAQVIDFVTDAGGSFIQERMKFALVEFFTETEVVIAAMFPSSGESPAGGIEGANSYVPIILERIENKTGACQVVIGSRFTLDGEFRGQFDQIVGVLEAHVRLMGLVMDYADQSVYSDIWVKDLIGELSWGGGAYIELGPQGAIGRVPPAVTSLNVAQDLDRLVDGIHLGGRWPKSRPGQVDQSIASAKFVEAVAGVMNTAIKTYHQLLARMIEHALRLSFITDQKYFPGEKTATGILRNQEFVEDYNASTDIDMRNRVRVEYGLGLGRDPAQSAVLMLQYAEKGYISNEFVQENIDGLTDVARERIRTDVEQFQKMLLANLLNGLQSGEIPKEALVEIMEARAKGEDLAALYRKWVIEPAKQAQAPAGPGATGLEALLGGGAPDAAPPGPDGLPAPGQPLDGGPPVIPPAPNPQELISRISVPAGNRGSFLSSQSR